MRPILAAAEGATVEVPAGFDGGRYRLTGNVTGQRAVSRPPGPPWLGGGEVRAARLVGDRNGRPRRGTGGS